MSDSNIYYHRNLPHYQPTDGSAFFITTRLARTLPQSVVHRIQSEYKKELNFIEGCKLQKQKRERYEALRDRTFIKYEKILDSLRFGRNWLSDDRIAEIIKHALHYRDTKKYKLIAYTIMPNHIHLVFIPIVSQILKIKGESKVELNSELNYGSNIERFVGSLKKNISETKSESRDSLYIVTKIMQDLKKYTAGKANKVLDRKGQFWQHESYDHVIRNQDELHKIVEYILNNPVKARLCDNYKNWKWNYYNPSYF